MLIFLTPVKTNRISISSLLEKNFFVYIYIVEIIFPNFDLFHLKLFSAEYANIGTTNMATADEHCDPLKHTLKMSDAEATAQHASLWDPFLSKDWEKERPTEQCILRIKR